jgi:hypothetical protein
MSKATSPGIGADAAARIFRIETIGPCAAAALTDGARGEIGAVFERCFYAVIGGQWLCLVPKGGGAGPLNATAGEPSFGDLAGRLRVGYRAIVREGALAAGPFIFSFSGANRWRPEPPRAWSGETVARGLMQLRQTIAARALPPEGLAPLLKPQAAFLNPVARAAQAPLQHLRTMIAKNGNARPDATPLIPLLGLGPGLTPSGDDAIGGALIALHLLGETRLRDRLWIALSPLAKEATGSVSLAHLSAAAEGFGHEVVHRLANAIVAGDSDLRDALGAVEAIGHTSGWDALVGIVTAFEAWRDAA